MTGAVTTATINAGAFAHNLETVRARVGGKPIMAVVKANGYGHDLSLLLPALGAADALAVARVSEAAALRQLGYEGRLLVLEGARNDDGYARAHRYGLDLVVHHATQIAALERAAGKYRIWLKLDTGMNRIGFRPEAFGAAYERIAASPRVIQPPVLMTHLACADEPDKDMTREQVGEFIDRAQQLPDGTELSVANSAGILTGFGMDWVRPGIMLYGISPFRGESGSDLGLKPVMTLRTRLIAIKQIRAGETVGYGATWKAAHDTLIGTAAAGYADGYPGNLPSGTAVLVGGQRRPLAGRVSMDMVTIDLGERSSAKVGDEVMLWGDGLPVEEVARAAGRIAYELVCGVTQRVPRLAGASS